MSEIKFQVEDFADEAGLARLVGECINAYAEHWLLGPNKHGPVFDPDLDGTVRSVADRSRVFVSARKEGKIVGLQNWYVGVNQDVKTQRIAYMTGIGRKDHDVDLKEFVRFGVAEMRRRGATRTVLTARVGVATLRPLFESIGARAVDVMMEV